MALTDEINFCPRCGEALGLAPRFGQERPVCPGCDWVYFRDPKVAAAALVVRDGSVLLIRRANEPYRGCWTLPAGFLNAGEDPARAAERECQEETGLEVRVTALFDVIPKREHLRGADIIICYTAEIIGGQLCPDDDAEEVGFFHFNDLPPLGFEATRQLLAKAQGG
ncbi:MAG: NUDIX hydrolase [Chloroflexota bacterium]